MDNNFMYQKKDFIKVGIAEGSFNHLIKKLNIDNPDFMCIKVLPNGIKAKFFNEKAMKIVLDYKKAKEESKNKNELLLLNQNTELKRQTQQLQNAIAILESQHSKEIINLKDEWHKKELQLTEEKMAKDKQLSEKQKEIEYLENMNLWQFIKWKRNHRY